VVRAFHAFHRRPRAAAVYNLGGGRESNISMLEAIDACERVAGRKLDWTISPEARIGDHRWYISDLSEFQRDYPDWSLTVSIEQILSDLFEANADQWTAAEA
jgi:CDP-paratose 2-epimerase